MARTFDIVHPIVSCARPVAAFLLCCLFFFQPPSARGGPVTGTEYDVKAGFIYNFANFVTWPKGAFKDSPGILILCLISDNPETDVLFKLDGKTVKGRTIKVMTNRQGNCLEKSHILYFATQNRKIIRKTLKLAKRRGILTIGEIEGFTRMGGIINFFTENNQLRFKVNVDAAKRQGLKLSSQILVSARIVHGEEE
jgi:hypothetical protein